MRRYILGPTPLIGIVGLFERMKHETENEAQGRMVA